MGPRARLTVGAVGADGSAHRDSRTPQLARPGRTQAEAKINAHPADRGRPVGGPNTHPHLTTQRASVHAGPGARAGPTAGPPRLPDLMGRRGEAGLLPAAGLAAIVGAPHAARTPKEAKERGPCAETRAGGQRDKPSTHNATGAGIPGGDTGIDTFADLGRCALQGTWIQPLPHIQRTHLVTR